MKKLLVLVSILVMLALPVTPQEPGPVYLPIILQGGGDVAYQVLEISDGTTTVNLLSQETGFYLLEWEPALAEPKGGGVWKDSQLAEGRILAMRKRANSIDTLTLAVRDWTPDDLIRDTQDLRRLLEKAYAYSETSWQDEPVWIKRHPADATYPEYTIIYDYRTPQDGNPHGSDTFWNNLAKAGFHEFVLVLEHEGFWRADQPGTGTCVQTSGVQEDWRYTDVWPVATNIPINQVEAMIVAHDVIIAGDRDVTGGGSITRSANGAVWAAATTNVTDAVYSLLQWNVDGAVYAATDGSGVGAQGIWRSTDDGVNWANVYNADAGAPWPNGLTNGSDGYMYGCFQTGTRRSNNGTAWAQVNTIASQRCIYQAYDGYIYLGANTKIYRSDDGLNWWEVYVGAAGFQCTDLLDIGGVLYAACSGGGANNKVMRSSNGTDWEDVTTVTGASMRIIYEDNIFYVTNGIGNIWESYNGTDWELIDDGTNVHSIIVYPSNGLIYYGDVGQIVYNNILVDMGRAATCTDEVYVANKSNDANLTHIFRYDASGAGSYTAVFPFLFPFNIYPNPAAVGDMIYFGIMTNVVDPGVFFSLVFDIGQGFLSDSHTIIWEYSDGLAGWPTLNVQDGTNGFRLVGVNSVHWVGPSDWDNEVVNLVDAYWVRARISALVNFAQQPTQVSREVYTIVRPFVDIDDLQVPGDVPALMQFKFHNQSDEDGYESTIDELDLLENRIITGLRSLDRGSAFVAYLNCSDNQQPFSIVATDGANTSDVADMDHPTGRSMQHTTTGLSTWTDECTFSLGPAIARDFYGSYHAYLRAQQVDWDTEIGEVRVRLQVRTGSGGVTFTTDHVQFRNLNDWQLLDFGGVDIPASGLFASTDLGDETELVIQIWSSISSLTVNLYDLILMPTDEWALDAVDKALEDDSGVANGYLLDADSVTYPKRDIRALVRQTGSAYVRSVYQPNTPGPAILQANADQRLWFLTARGAVLGSHTGANNQTTLTDSSASFLTSGVATGQVIFNITDGSVGTIGATVTATTITDCGLAGGTDNDWDTNDEYVIICPNWRSEPWNAHSVQAWAVARYLSMRGAR